MDVKYISASTANDWKKIYMEELQLLLAILGSNIAPEIDQYELLWRIREVKERISQCDTLLRGEQ